MPNCRKSKFLWDLGGDGGRVGSVDKQAQLRDLHTQKNPPYGRPNLWTNVLEHRYFFSAGVAKGVYGIFLTIFFVFFAKGYFNTHTKK